MSQRCQKLPHDLEMRVRSAPNKGRDRPRGSLQKCATFGPSDHLVGMRGKCRASSVSAGRGAGGVPRHPLPVACAHHRVERPDPRHDLPLSSEIAAAFAATRKLELPMVVPIRVLQLCRVALGSKPPMILRDKNWPRGRKCLEFYF